MSLLSRRPAAPSVPRYPAAAPSPEQPFTTAAEAGARLGQLNEARRKATEAIIALEQATRAVPAQLADRRPQERRQRALALLGSGWGAINAVERMSGDHGVKLAALNRLRSDIDAAVELGNQQAQALQASEFAGRSQAICGDYARNCAVRHSIGRAI